MRVVVVTGAGRGFCAGADTGALEKNVAAGGYDDGVREPLAEPGYGVRPEFDHAFAFHYGLAKPVIAAVNGPAAGVGLVLACYCDLRFAAAGAKLTTSAPRLGLPAEYGLSWVLPRLVGLGHAADLLLSSRVVLAEEAATMGLVNKVLAPEDLLPHTYAYARALATEVSPRVAARDEAPDLRRAARRRRHRGRALGGADRRDDGRTRLRRGRPGLDGQAPARFPRSGLTGPGYGPNVPTRLISVVVDAADPAALARFWSTATGWPVTYETPDEAVVEPPEDDAGRRTEPGLELVFGTVPEAKVGKNRVHIDLNSTSAEHQAELVERVRRAGATPLDLGQGAVPWVVLADPEGNEFCILEPRDVYAEAGAVAAVVVDTPDPHALAPFWEAASGWVGGRPATTASACGTPTGRGPWLELLPTDDPKVVKNRVHLDVAPYAADDQAAEVERLKALGATDVDIGQGEQTWVVLADPQGGEFCVLSSRDD